MCSIKTSEQVKFLEQIFVFHAILILVSVYYYLLLLLKSCSTSFSQAPFMLLKPLIY